MSPSNYPDGVQEQDIPGNRPEDERAQRIAEQVECFTDPAVMNDISENFPKVWSRVVEFAREELVEAMIEKEESGA